MTVFIQPKLRKLHFSNKCRMKCKLIYIKVCMAIYQMYKWIYTVTFILWYSMWIVVFSTFDDNLSRWFQTKYFAMIKISLFVCLILISFGRIIFIYLYWPVHTSLYYHAHIESFVANYKDNGWAMEVNFSNCSICCVC